jgi:hypothetical protein
MLHDKNNIKKEDPVIIIIAIGNGIGVLNGYSILMISNFLYFY